MVGLQVRKAHLDPLPLSRDLRKAFVVILRRATSRELVYVAGILLLAGLPAPLTDFGEAAHQFCASSGSQIPDKRGRAECSVGR